MSHMLQIQGLCAGYGPIQALHHIDLDVQPGEIVALIGANGAGKSTLLMSLCGVVRPTAGRVWFEGLDITGMAPHHIARQGIAQVPEGRRIFARMSVQENLLMGATLADPAVLEADLERVYGLFPQLRERQEQRGGTLSGGEQQMLAVGRALMSHPRLLLLDEPSLGLAPLMAQHIFKIVREIAETGTTLLLVEQNAYAALHLAHRAYVLANGRVVQSGTAQALLNDPAIHAAYLGE